MPSSYSFVCCGYTKDGTGQRYFAPVPHPLATPYYPPDSYQPTSYRVHRPELMPAVPGGHRRDSDDSAPNRFQPSGHPPPMVPGVPVVPRLPSPPIRLQEYPGSIPEPVMVVPPIAVPSPILSPPPQPQLVMVQTSPPHRGSPVPPPVVIMPQMHHKVDQNRRRRLSPNQGSESESYAPARTYRSERIPVSPAPPTQQKLRSPRRPRMVVDSDADSYTQPHPHILERAERRRPAVVSESGSSSRPAPNFSLRKVKADEGPQLNISIDIGTEFSAIAYSGYGISGIRDIASWPGSNESINKIPTCLVYNALGAVQAWGIQAKQMPLEKDWTRCEWFKLDTLLNPGQTPYGFYPLIPTGKRSLDLMVDFICCLLKHMKDHETLGRAFYSKSVCLTVPGSWGIPQHLILKEAFDLAASQAEFKCRFADVPIMTKVEATAVYCAHLDAFPVERNHAFCICNAGARYFDLATYRFLGREEHPEFAEACIRSGSDGCGSLSLDLSFRTLLYKLQRGEGINLDPPNFKRYMEAFGRLKLTYQGDGSGDDMVYFHCSDPSDHRAVGLVNGQLAISSQVLHRDVFEPTISKVLDSIDRQLGKTTEPVDALFLVGGFFNNEYLFTRVKGTFGARIKSVMCPRGADVAACRGAALYGCHASVDSPLISSIVAPKSFIVSVELPVEPEDLEEHAQFISTNSQNIQMCANRALYLVRKGENTSKQEPIRAKFRKYSESSIDYWFSTAIYSSDSEQTSRYTIGGEMKELCRLKVDLRQLPIFSMRGMTSKPYYTDFEVGFRLDNGVSGVLYDEKDNSVGQASIEVV